jgi:hypothetical protein
MFNINILSNSILQPNSTSVSRPNSTSVSRSNSISIPRPNSTSILRPNSTSISRPNSSQLSPLNVSNFSSNSPHLSPLNGSNYSQDSFVAVNWDYDKFEIRNLTDPLDSYYALEYVFKILGEVIENVVESGRKHFRKDDITEIAKKMRGQLKIFKHQDWDNNDQKVQFINILKNHVHLYNRFLWLVVRYCAGKLFLFKIFRFSIF